MNVSIIMPLYKADHKIMEKINSMLEKQKFKGKLEVIKVDKGLGLAASINYGIKKAKYDTIVTLHQDCIPSERYWLQKLVSPLKQSNVVASVSKVELPKYLWKEFDIFTKALTIKELGIIYPSLDEKGCAYKKYLLKKVGLFDEKNFGTSGEDLDMYLKLRQIGKIAHPNAKVIHMHSTTLYKRLRKTAQNANGYGAAIKIIGLKFPKWPLGILAATPILGLAGFVFSYKFKKSALLFIPYLIISPVVHLCYMYGFWKGFLMEKQTI